MGRDGKAAEGDDDMKCKFEHVGAKNMIDMLPSVTDVVHQNGAA